MGIAEDGFTAQGIKNKSDSQLKVDTEIKQTYFLPPEVTRNIKKSVQIALKDKKIIKESLIEVLSKDKEFLREILNEIHKAEDNESITRDIDKVTAKREIEEYIDTHPRCRTGHIIDDLQLDPEIVMEILKELKEEGSIQSKQIE